LNVHRVDGGAGVLASQDLYLHIAVGRWILANHSIPDHGIFSASMPDAPWVARMTDPNLRNSSIENVARQWLQSDRKAAESWLAQTSLPDDRKQRLLVPKL